MELEIVNEALEDSEDILNVKAVKETVFRDIQYQIIIECDMVVTTLTVPIVIAIPQNWMRSLIDIYIQQNKNFPFYLCVV